jgi:hypothetical protein
MAEGRSYQASGRLVTRFVVLALMTLPTACGSREAAIPKSQHARLEQRVGRATITIEYSRPVARGRRLFGGIVPFGKTWDPGADAASAIRVSRDVEIEGHVLPRGTYSIWAIPGPDAWTVILSGAAHVFHEPYPEGQDAIRFRVTPTSGSHMETLAFYFPLVDADSALLVLHWGETVVPIHLRAR